MVWQGRARGRTQRGCFYTVLIRSDDMLWQEPSADGDADVGLLGIAAVPVFKGSRGRLRGMGGKDPGLVCGAP